MLLAAVLASACASSGPATAPGSTASDATASDTEDAPAETAAGVDDMTADNADAAAVADALAAAAEGAPYRLVAHCADDKGIRGFELFPDGVAIWRSSSQFQVPETLQRSLANLLRSGGFAEFKAQYGGKEDAGAGEPAPAKGEKGKAPLTIRCRITFDDGEVSKTSVQDLYGHQFAPLLELSDALLDRVEPLTADAVTADDLEDGLDKLVAGDLSPRTFELRVVALPEAGAGEEGFIFRIEDGMISRRPYAPGKKLGEGVSEPVDRAVLERLITAVRDTDFMGLPNNVYADGQIEVEVRVLDHHKAVLGRSFQGLKDADQGDARQRLVALVGLVSSVDVG